MTASALVSSEWLIEHLEAPELRVVDATWFLPTVGRDAKAEHRAAHLPGAVFFDIDDIAADDSPYPHMLPGQAKFSSRMRRLGLGDGTRIVVYDNNGFMASARAWWMLRLFGHPEVAVLDGGLAKWQREERPVTDAPVRATERHFTPRQNTLLLRELDQMRANLTRARDQVIDARSSGRFHAQEPEPRPGLRGGHIPGSRNLPWNDLVAKNGTLRPPEELRQGFEVAGIDLRRPITTSCGSGVSAAVLTLALYELGRDDVAVYDGSWSEWAAQPDTPVAA